MGHKKASAENRSQLDLALFWMDEWRRLRAVVSRSFEDKSS